ncbi:ABC transporter permease [Metasolibacillus meyeri]|uniref:ABC transporter permease n=1 Tax=Metasolibacillus meyeri TaxID=1071052 RepID=UPI000D306F12|nr:ABC transporter permease [Metasolibacillus meyeri]
MMTTFLLALKSSLRGVYLITYSIILPLVLFIGLGLYFPTAHYQYQLLAGVIGVSIIFWAMVTSAFTIYQQQMQGVYKLLRITPVSFTKFSLATISAWIIVSIILTVVLILASVTVLAAKINIMQLAFLLLFVVIGTVGFALTAFIVAFISKSINQVSMYTNLIALPLIALSQAFYAITNLPKWLQTLSLFNPFQYFVRGMYEVLLMNYGNAMGSLIIVMVIIIILLTIANLAYKKAFV